MTTTSFIVASALISVGLAGMLLLGRLFGDPDDDDDFDDDPWCPDATMSRPV